MKHFITSLCLILLSLFAKAQLPGNFNLISNSSFELNSDTDIQDTSFSMSKSCWIKANKSPAAIPHLVKTASDPRLPFAHSDSSALLIVSTSGWYKISTLTVFDSSLDIRNYAQTPLLKSLVAGTTYYLSFYAGQTKMSGKFHFSEFGVNIPNIGAYFSKDKISDYTNNGRINITPQINFKSWTIVKFDTFEYVKLTAAYTAIGDEQYLTIGNFDYFKNFLLYNYHKDYILGLDTLQAIPYSIYIDDLSLVSDTTLPIISLTQFSLGNDTSLACAGDSIRLGGEDRFFHYWWNTGDTTRFITAKTPGKYWCTVDFGCSTFTDTINISSLPFSFSLGADTSIPCTGSILKLKAPAGGIYVWSTGESSAGIDVHGPGIYWCRADNGCAVFTDTIHIVATPFSFSLGADTSMPCTGSILKLKAPAGGTYVWSTGESSAGIDVHGPGIYWCRADNGCAVFTDTIHIVATPFTFSLGADTSIYCLNDSIKLSVSIAGTYLWSNGESSAGITVRAPGIYWCRVSDGCTTFTDTIIINSIFESFSLGNDTIICNNIPLKLTTAAAKTHLWSTGETTASIELRTAGTYWCSADFGCNTVTDTIVISGSVAPDPFNIGDTALCEVAMPISISAPYTAAAYLWSNGSTGFTASFATVGKHWLRISNACGDKSVTDTFEIKSLNVALGNIYLGNDTSNCLFDYYLDTITLQVPINTASNIIWSTGSSNPLVRVFEPGTYWVQVSNVCYSVSDTINISGCANRTVEKIGIPNAFTPNGDGKNDVFRILYLPGQVVSYSLKIFNRYGQMIKELKNRNDYWDGGKYELGVYYYLFVYKDVTGKEYLQKGDLSLIR